MALEPYALTTFDEAADYLGLEPTELTAKETARLERLIHAMSDAAMKFAGRGWAPKVPTLDTDPPVTLKFKALADGLVVFSPYELRSLTTITVDGGDALAADEYTLQPLNGEWRTGTYRWLDLETEPEVGVTVAITGRWGCNVIPQDVEEAVLIAVFNGWYSPGGYASTASGPYVRTEEDEASAADKSLPGDSRALLFAHRRPVLGAA